MTNDILVLDSDGESRQRVIDALSAAGYAPRQASDGDDAVAAIDERLPNAALVDIGLGGRQRGGMALLRWLLSGPTYVPVVALAGRATRDQEASALGAGAFHVLDKSHAPDWAPFVTARALESARLRQENTDLMRRAGGPPELVGQSSPIQQLRSAVDRVAPTGSRVLIAGPSGSGKEIVARLLHQRSQRREGPFELVNCAAHTAPELEAALFGTARPANGASSERTIGAAERAHGGTLVLDEVAAIPLGTQQKLLRLLQEQAFERVGGSQRVGADIRVIATSAQDLNEAIAAGQFRQALYYRLNVVPVRVPALVERREDIPVLAEHLMTRVAASLGMAPRSLTEDAIAALQAYPWPGNVRQLRTAIEWMLIADGSEPLGADSLPPDVHREVAADMHPDGSTEMMGLPLREARELFERHYLLTHLTRFGGNISKTAAFVGMERTALHRKLKTLGVANGERLS